MKEAQMCYPRLLSVTLLLFSGFFSSCATSDRAGKHPESDKACKSYAYDNGPVGQQTWCGFCNDASQKTQAPINIPSNTPEPEQPAIQFLEYKASTELVIYENNPYNLKVNYSKGTSSIRIGDNTFRLGEFHFHRPSEEAIDNHRYPMVVHLVHTRCEVGKPDCVAVITVLIEQGEPSQKTSDLLKILFQHFPPPTGEQKGVQISVEALLPAGYDNAGYYRYDGSLTTPECTGNITFYVLKPRLKFSAEQLAEFERHYPSPNARDIQPLNNREIKNRR